jgi:alpha-tubulin suppressor-like RCC1 family protein
MRRKIVLACLIIVAVCGVAQLPASASTPKPKITSFNPTSGNAGTTEVTIKGTHLGHATRVTFNGTTASVILDHAAKIETTVPDGSTTGYIRVTTRKGTATSPSIFTVVLDSTSTATIPASSSIGIGYGDSDRAVVSGNASRGSPTGTVTFYGCGPTASPESCTSQANEVGSPVDVTGGTNDTSSASSVSFTANSTGYWCFAGYYSGDTNYEASSDTTTDECVDVYTPLDDAMSVVSGADGYCALLTSGGVDCWGYGNYGALGNGSYSNSATPVAVEGVGGIGTLTGVTSLFSGSDSYCALLTSGAVDCWGYGPDGELGNGTFYTTGNYGSPTPVQVEGVGGTGILTGVTSLFSGYDGYCAVLTSGAVDCWGAGQAGVLGNGSFSNSATPVAVEGVGGSGTLTGVTSLVSGNLDYCALLTSDRVDCWGDGYYGELGDGSFYTTGNDGSATPVAVEGVGGTGTLTGVTSLVSNPFDNCAVLSSGTADCWGAGGTGALGNGTFAENSATPVTVEGVGGTGTLSGLTRLVGEGSLGFCAVLTSGGVDCWGNGYYGELGNGTFYTTANYGSATPVEVEGVGGTGTLTAVTNLLSGSVNYCVLLSSGAVDCWGYGEDGDLGNGTFYLTSPDGSATPVEVG